MLYYNLNKIYCYLVCAFSLVETKLHSFNIIASNARFAVSSKARCHQLQKQSAKLKRPFPKSIIRLYGQTKHLQNPELNTFYRTTYECENFAYTVFASQRMINLIARYAIDDRKFMMDATFKVVPHLFQQLSVIYFATPTKQVKSNKILINCSYSKRQAFNELMNVFFLLLFMNQTFQTFPFIFVLMTRKTEKAYTHIFNYIEKNVCSLKCFMTDFEAAMRNGLKSLDTGAIFNTCWFHVCQAVRRRVAKNFGLITLIQTNETARELYKKILALPLLPAPLIRDAFMILKGEILTRFSRAFREFLRYYERQWIEKVRFLSITCLSK